MVTRQRKRLSLLGGWIGLVLVLQGYSCPMGEGSPVRAGDRDGEIRVGTLRRVYHLHIPPSYDGAVPVPLVLVFHGLLETSGEMVGLTGFSHLADQKGFIVVYPDSIGRHWNDGRGTTALAPRDVDDVGFVAALIEHLKDTLAIDPTRIYATGMSNGGMFVQRLACELSGQLAAIGPVSGTMAKNIATQCTPQQRVSVVEFHGTKDAFVTWDGGSVRALGGKVLSVPNTMTRWTQLDGCHSTPPATFDDFAREPRNALGVRRVAYGPCPEGIDVVLYVIGGGRHHWPHRIGGHLVSMGRGNQGIDATEAMWDFFARHPKRTPGTPTKRFPGEPLIIKGFL